MLIGLIRLYQALSAGRPPACRYTPSCSQYAIEAIERHGPIRGVVLAARRVARCNPFSSGGYDPAPPERQPASGRPCRHGTPGPADPGPVA